MVAVSIKRCKSVHVKEENPNNFLKTNETTRNKDIAKVTTQKVRWNLPRGHELIELCAS